MEIIKENSSPMWNIFVQRFVWPGFTAAMTFAVTEFWALQTLKDTVHDNKTSIKFVIETAIPQVKTDLTKEITDRKESGVLTEKRIEYIVGLLESSAKDRTALTEQISQVLGMIRLQNQMK